MSDLKETADKLLTAFNAHDAGALARLYTEDQVTFLSGAPEPVRGRKGKEELVSGFFRAFPDLNMDLALVLVSGNHIVCEGELRGTHTGPLVSHEGEIPPTRRSIKVPLIFILRAAPDGLIEEDRTYFDNATFLGQLGLMPQLGAAQSTEANKALLRRLCEEEDKGNFTIFDELCTPDYVFHLASNPEPFTREENKQLARALYAAFPDLLHEIQDLIAVEDKVVARLTFPGTHKGEWQGVAPTGKHATFAGVVIARITGGKIVEMWAQLDMLGLLQQLGAAPPLGKDEEKAAA